MKLLNRLLIHKKKFAILTVIISLFLLLDITVPVHSEISEEQYNTIKENAVFRVYIPVEGDETSTVSYALSNPPAPTDGNENPVGSFYVSGSTVGKCPIGTSLLSIAEGEIASEYYEISSWKIWSINNSVDIIYQGQEPAAEKSAGYVPSVEDYMKFTNYNDSVFVEPLAEAVITPKNFTIPVYDSKGVKTDIKFSINIENHSTVQLPSKEDVDYDTLVFKYVDSGEEKSITLNSAEQIWNYIYPNKIMDVSGMGIYSNITMTGGTAELSIDSWKVGETPSQPVVKSETNGTDNVSITYRSADGNEYTSQVPTEVGDYYVKAVFPATSRYKEIVIEKPFSISYEETPEKPYTILGNKGNNNWYRSQVEIIPADGYEISYDKNIWQSKIVVNESKPESYVYLKGAKGGITEKIKLDEILIDTQIPQINGVENGKIYVQNEIQATVFDENLCKVTVNGENLDISNNTANAVLKAGQQYEIIAEDKAGNQLKYNVTVNKPLDIAEIVEITSSGDYNLQGGTQYKFVGETWKVNGDDTIYYGGNTFYVKATDKYTLELQ